MNEELLQEETKVAEDTVAEAAAQTEPQTMADPVSYTHLDVYKRQPFRQKPVHDLQGRLHRRVITVMQ